MSKLTSFLKKAWRPVAGVAGLAVIIVWSAGSCAEKVSPGSVDAPAGIAVPDGAATVEVKVEPLATRIYVVGTTASEEKINLSARLPAYVKAVFVNAGDAVTNGQVLVTLDDREIREQLTAAEAQFKQAEAEYERARGLFEKNATTQQALTAAESMFQSARAQVDQVKVMLTYAQIAAPIDGVVTDRRIEAGDLANPGMLLLAVYDPARMRLEAPVPVRLIDRLALGQEVDVALERPARTLKGQGRGDRQRGGPVQPHAEGQGPARGRRRARCCPARSAGSGWKTSLATAIRVPQSAVYRSGQLELVQVARDGRAIRRLVKTGPEYGDTVEILSGLKAGETILAEPRRED